MKEFILLLPEIFLAVTVAGLVFAEVGYHGERVRLVISTALLGLGGAFVQTLISYQYDSAQIFGHALSIDAYSIFFKLFFITLAALAVVSSARSKEILVERRAEYCALIIAAALGMCTTAAATDLLLAFLCLQFLNLICHFLTAFGRRNMVSTEAAVKHLLFSVVAGILLLYASALLFSATRTINIVEMQRALTAAPLAPQTAWVVFTLIFLSLGFQFAAFPMHLWAPDVLEGAPTPVSAFISIGSRAAGFAFGLRLILTIFAKNATAGQWEILGQAQWPTMVAFLAGATMLAGALMAFRQQAAKRLVACLVVSQTGFLMMGLLVLDEAGLAALLYNLVAELFALMGTFYVISLFQDEIRSDRLTEWRGLLGRAVPETVALILFLGSLVGLPPLAGFIGRFSLVGAAIDHQWFGLAVIAMLSWAIASISITRVAFSLVGDFKTASAAAFPKDSSRLLYLGAFLIPMILISLFADGVFSWVSLSLRPFSGGSGLLTGL